MHGLGQATLDDSRGVVGMPAVDAVDAVLGARLKRLTELPV